MSSPKYDWWQSAIWAIRNYPARKTEYDELHTVSLTAQMSGMPSGTNVSRTTETIALRTMPPAKQREYDAVSRAIEITKLLPGGEERLELIKRVYWSGKKKSLYQVIPQLHIGETTGKRWHARFVRLVGECLGYMES